MSDDVNEGATPENSPELAEGFEARLADYLVDHPDFLERHPEVLAALEIAHRQSGAVSLVERQVRVLREQIEQLQGRMGELIGVAERNHRLYEAIGAMTRRLLQVETVAALLEVLDDSLLATFTADHVAILLFAEHLPLPKAVPDDGRVVVRHASLEEPGLESVAGLVADGSPRCGPLPDSVSRGLFPEIDAPLMASAVLLPLRTDHAGHAFGLLAIASADGHRYTADQGTEFMQQVASVVAAVLERLLHVD